MLTRKLFASLGRWRSRRPGMVRRPPGREAADHGGRQRGRLRQGVRRQERHEYVYGPKGKGKGTDPILVYEEGYFSYDGSSHWLACKEPGGGERYGIFAGTIDRTDCEKIKLVAVPTTDPKQGAYSYT